MMCGASGECCVFPWWIHAIATGRPVPRYAPSPGGRLSEKLPIPVAFVPLSKVPGLKRVFGGGGPDDIDKTGFFDFGGGVRGL